MDFGPNWGVIHKIWPSIKGVCLSGGKVAEPNANTCNILYMTKRENLEEMWTQGSDRVQKGQILVCCMKIFVTDIAIHKGLLAKPERSHLSLLLSIYGLNKLIDY